MQQNEFTIRNNRKKEINTVDLYEAKKVKMKQISPKPWAGNQTTRTMNNKSQSIRDIYQPVASYDSM